MTKQTFLDLGMQPLSNNFHLDPEHVDYWYNLEVQLDTSNNLVSLKTQPPGDKMFNEDYPYKSSGSRTMRDHFYEAANIIKMRFPHKKILEIGSNDGVFIKNFSPDGAYCVEPCSNFARITQSLGYDTFNTFWDEETANAIPLVDVVYAANCMCHIPDIQTAFHNVAKVLNGGGVFVFEDPSLQQIIKQNSYDQIYDEHVHIFSVLALHNLLQNAGLQLIDVQALNVHGGSNRILAVKSSLSQSLPPFVEAVLNDEKNDGLRNLEALNKFAERIKKSRTELRRLLGMYKQQGGKIISYGATSKSTTIFNYCDIGTDIIDYISDTTPAKVNRYSPGKHIPVRMATDRIPDDVDVAYLGAWNFIDEICNKEKAFLDRGGKFITHVPNPRVIGSCSTRLTTYVPE